MSDKFIVQSYRAKTGRRIHKYAKVWLNRDGAFKGLQFIENPAEATLCSRAEAEFLIGLAKQRQRKAGKVETEFALRRIA